MLRGRFQGLPELPPSEPVTSDVRLGLLSPCVSLPSTGFCLLLLPSCLVSESPPAILSIRPQYPEQHISRFCHSSVALISWEDLLVEMQVTSQLDHPQVALSKKATSFGKKKFALRELS